MRRSKAGRLGDSCSGHGCFPATPIVAGSPDVSINGKPAARKGDTVLLHACPCPQVPHGVHGRAINAGSSNVSINGKPAARVGDAINCGGSVAAGSGDVFIGDTPYKGETFDCGKRKKPLI
ncbi:PAAR domain-containing protein [Vibrio quintilis]|uniref:PAAR domain-containing protein n=1 Tax=Vibrio quintilis TaxID=1117707 RepID=UPI002905DF79|nr:PAAR domain-containing protein [Vibrio quintilis]